MSSPDPLEMTSCRMEDRSVSPSLCSPSIITVACTEVAGCTGMMLQREESAPAAGGAGRLPSSAWPGAKAVRQNTNIFSGGALSA